MSSYQICHKYITGDTREWKV